MVMCKFFLQGTCKFGDYCRFEHQVPTTYTNFGDTATSVLRQSNFGAPQQTGTSVSSKSQNVDTNTLVKSVVNDMISAEKGSQWLLSCYAPFKEKPAFPGFSDQSFEEIRLGYYEAVKNRTVEQYKVQLQQMIQEVVMKIKALQNPSPEIINILKNIYSTPVSSSTQGNVFSSNTSSNFGQQSSVFSHQTSGGTSIFAKANQNLFPATASAPTNTFGSSNNSIFGAPQSNSVFGAPTQPANQTVFANQTTNTSLFAQSNAGASSIFGAQQNASQPVFGQQNTQSVFGAPVQVPSQAVQTMQPLQQNAGQSPFGAQPQTGNSIFSVQQSANMQPAYPAQPQPSSNTMFAAPQVAAPQQNIFGNQMQHQPNLSNINSSLMNQPLQNAAMTSDNQNPLLHLHTASIFGAPQMPQGAGSFTAAQQQQSGSILAQPNANQQNTNIFGGINPQSDVVDESLYSKLEELTDEEKKWFESDDLDIYSIPEKPPTYEMCFKT